MALYDKFDELFGVHRAVVIFVMFIESAFQIEIEELSATLSVGRTYKKLDPLEAVNRATFIFVYHAEVLLDSTAIWFFTVL